MSLPTSNFSFNYDPLGKFCPFAFVLHILPGNKQAFIHFLVFD